MKTNNSLFKHFKVVIAIALAIAISASSFSLNVFATNSLADNGATAINSDNIAFDVAYPEVGKEMKIVVPEHEAETYLYKWYINNEQISNYTATYTPIEDNLEKMITVEVYDINANLVGTRSVFLSKLPVVYIEVDNRATPRVKGEVFNSRLTIQGNNEFNDASVLYNGAAEIKVRGNSTADSAKKPYKIKLDAKTNVLGMGKSKHWVLLSNPYDQSNLRNDISYKLAADMGVCAMSTQFVDVVLNGISVGLYQLCEHVRVDEERVNISNWESIAEDAAKAIYKHKDNKANFTEDVDKDGLKAAMTANLNWLTTDKVTYKGKTYSISKYYNIPDVTGGFLMKVDNCVDVGEYGYKAPDGKIYQIDTPEYSMIKDSALEKYATGYFNAFENAALSKDFCTEYEGKTMRYTDFIDIESFAKGFLLNELFQNEDFGHRSTYMYKDINGKLTYGPIWDMDYAVSKPAKTVIMNRFPWIKAISSDPVMLNAIRDYYWQYRYNIIQELIAENGRVETTFNKIKEAAAHNDELWHPAFPSVEFKNEYYQRLQYKIQWMDKTFATLDSAMSTIASCNHPDNTNHIPYNIKSSAVALTFNNGLLNIKCSDNSAYANVYVNGILVNKITNTTNSSITIDNADNITITVVTYDADNNVLNGNYYTNSNPVTSLILTSKPNKMSYNVGDTLDLTGLVLTAKFKDGTTKVVDPDLTYTYTKDALSTQNFAFNKVTDKSGQRYLVIRYREGMVETPIQVSKSENYTKVIELINSIPVVANKDYVHNQDFVRTACEAKVEYNALSESAKKLVTNKKILDDAFEALCPSTEANNIDQPHTVGIYATGILRLEAMNKFVFLIRKYKNSAPSNIQLVFSNNSTSTLSTSSATLFSTTDLGDFVAWTVDVNCGTSYTTTITVRTRFSNYESNSYLPVTNTYLQKQFITSPHKIKNITYSNVSAEDYNYTLDCTGTSAQTRLNITDNGSSFITTDSYVNSVPATFKSSGFHPLTFNYYGTSSWRPYKSANIYISSSVITVGKPCTFNFNCQSDVQSIKILEGDKAIAESTNITNIPLTFTTAGTHNLTIQYMIDGKWFTDRIMSVYAHNAPENNKVFYESNVNGAVTIITDESFNKLYYVSSSDNVKLNAVTVNGYKIWTGTAKATSGYKISTNTYDCLLVTSPKKTVYKVGEQFDITGMTVFALSGKTEYTIATNDCTITEPDMSKAGKQKVTVCYQGLSASFTITVVDSSYIFNNGLQVDTTNNIIYGIEPGTKSLDKYFNTNTGLTYTCTKYGTGGIVTVYKNKTVVDTFTILIYGDINGDGWYNGQDAMMINVLCSGEKLSLSEVEMKSADCNHDGVIDQKDFALLESAGIFLKSVNQNPGSTDITTASAYKSYLSLINQSVAYEDSVIPEIIIENNDTNPQDNPDNPEEPEQPDTPDSPENPEQNPIPTFFDSIINTILRIFKSIANLFSFLA